MTALQITLIVLGGILLYLGLVRVIRKLSQAPAPPFVGLFLDSGLRRFFQPADKLIERSGIREGMKVLDLGCGSGAYTTFAARVVEANGKVYAIDIELKMLNQLRRKLRRPEFQDIKNIEIKQASAHELPLENESIDLVYMVTVLPEIPASGKALQEVKRVLKPGGILAATEFFPDPDYPLRSTTIRMGQEQGFVLEASMGNFWNYTVRFMKPARQD